MEHEADDIVNQVCPDRLTVIQSNVSGKCHIMPGQELLNDLP